jgi:shikimate kinase
MPNLYLTGMMGSGKSVTGKCLAQYAGYSFVDLDERIQEKLGRSINEIFENEGEGFFREQETAALKETAAAGNCVVATGGGAVLRPENIEMMKRSGKIIFLETSLGVLWERVKTKKDRPLLKGQDPLKNLEKIFSDRRAAYEKSADLKVNSDGKTAEAVAHDIMALLKQTTGAW